MNELTIKVAGMKCSGCETRIGNALTTLEGIQSVEAHHEDGIVIIKGDSINPEIIAEKLEMMDFEVIKEEA